MRSRGFIVVIAGGDPGWRVGGRTIRLSDLKRTSEALPRYGIATAEPVGMTTQYGFVDVDPANTPLVDLKAPVAGASWLSRFGLGGPSYRSQEVPEEVPEEVQGS